MDLPVTTTSLPGREAPEAIVFIKRSGSSEASTAAQTCAAILVVSTDLEVEGHPARVALLVRADNPRLTFARLAANLLEAKPAPGIDSTAHISRQAQIDPTACVEQGVTVGTSVIGPGCHLMAGATVLDSVMLTEDVTVYPGAVIGTHGFGYERDDSGTPQRLPHMGGVWVGQGVDIGANAVIDRGTIDDTRIGAFTKIDNLVHVAHNVKIGRGCLIAANAVIAGSAALGDHVWVGPSACVSNGITIGDEAEISLGAVVTQDVTEGVRVSGNFAIAHARFLDNLRAMRG
jgi:UDP-3-O-[3-hydroxymyristoyl] glucosamine N-acyltransferase